MGVERSPESVLVLNADEPLTSSLGLDVPNRAEACTESFCGRQPADADL